MSRAHGVELLPEAVLELEVLGDCLDDDVAVLQRAEIGHEAQPSQGGVPVGRLKFALLDELLQRFDDAGLALVERGLGDFPYDGGVSGRRRDLGDAASHEAAAEHADFLDIRHEILSG